MSDPKKLPTFEEACRQLEDAMARAKTPEERWACYGMVIECQPPAVVVAGWTPKGACFHAGTENPVDDSLQAARLVAQSVIAENLRLRKLLRQSTAFIKRFFGGRIAGKEERELILTAAKQVLGKDFPDVEELT